VHQYIGSTLSNFLNIKQIIIKTSNAGTSYTKALQKMHIKT